MAQPNHDLTSNVGLLKGFENPPSTKNSIGSIPGPSFNSSFTASYRLSLSQDPLPAYQQACHIPVYFQLSSPCFGIHDSKIRNPTVKFRFIKFVFWTTARH